MTNAIQPALLEVPNQPLPISISEGFGPNVDITLYLGDRLALFAQIPDGSAQLVVTSPPYNLGKVYEQRLGLKEYLEQQAQTIAEAVRILTPSGSICWQVGNHISEDGEVFPLDILLYPLFKAHNLRLRNRIVWHFGHGLHCTNRFSGRHETILWFTKTDDYFFDLEPIRVPQKYPGKKHFKGPRRGQYSSNPLGKNPSDVWDIPNVKANHIEKTVHPCQFPVELVERLVLSMTRTGDLIVDPYIGVGTTAVAAALRGRRAAGADTEKEYLEIARERVTLAALGKLKTRPIGTPVYEPPSHSPLARRPPEWGDDGHAQPG